ncbi:MAG: FAD-binding oxidoreductase [Chloroflexi bacterium]|nr:FAD-binding oxidoreductase [Chloroflexota bacterium]
MKKYNIVIIGGGIIGSSIAYFLARAGRGGSIALIEADSSYRLAATPQGAGGVRQLFSLPENIWMSRYSVNFYADFAANMQLDGELADVNFHRQGYLFTVGSRGAAQLEANVERQIAQGVHVELLDANGLNGRFPSVSVDDIMLASYSPEDGWVDQTAVHQAFQHKAKSLGVSLLETRIVNLEQANNVVKTAVLEDGQKIEAELFVNAAGAWAAEIAAMVDMNLPIQPLCRLQHYWQSPATIEPLPLIKDETGLFFRPEGSGFVGGCPSWKIEPGFAFSPHNKQINKALDNYFERVVWPLLVQRLPKFNQLRCEQTWAGHYAQNSLDGNMILGPWVGGAENFFVACGFSGHGIMHAPAVGMALSELILDGQYSTMDLSQMSYQRVLDNMPYKEMGII